MLNEIETAALTAVKELVEIAKLEKGDILVVGCSSSEMLGEKIGSHSSVEAAEAAFRGIYPYLCEKGIYLAFQCCEHLNRALVVDREVMEQYNLTEVSVVPHIHAGGSMGSYAYRHKKDAVMVESIQAHGGLDIGETLIGMHLRPVAVPKRLQVRFIGNARLNTAVCRPKLIGGERAKYAVEDDVCNM